MQVKIYTDGAARGNPDGPGGYGAILHYVDTKGQLHERELSRGYKKTTNNRMELMAAIAALEALTKPCQVDLYSDSKYLVDAFNQHWIDSWLKKNWKRGKNEDVKNVDLWKRLLKAKELHQVTFHWVALKRFCKKTFEKRKCPFCRFRLPWNKKKAVQNRRGLCLYLQEIRTRVRR